MRIYKIIYESLDDNNNKDYSSYEQGHSYGLMGECINIKQVDTFIFAYDIEFSNGHVIRMFHPYKVYHIK